MMHGGDLEFVVLLGSLRQHSCLSAVAYTLDELAPDDVEVTQLGWLGNVPLYSGGLEHPCLPAAVIEIGRRIAEADALIVAAPEHRGSVPGMLKNAIDWLGGLPQQPVARKPTAIQSASLGTSGGLRAQRYLRDVLCSFDADVLSEPEVAISCVCNVVDRTTRLLRDAGTRDLVAAQLAALARIVRLRRHRPH